MTTAATPGAPARWTSSLTRLGAKDDEEHQRPLDFRLIMRLMESTRPYAAMRNWLVALVIARSIQLPALTWILTAVMTGPVAAADFPGVLWGTAAFTVLALTTQWVMHYRQLYALELGEAVVHDLRNRLFAHLQTMPLSFYHRTKVGRVISRMVSDIEDVRVGVQEVLFVSLVQVGQILVAALCMLWYDWQLFFIVLALAPVLWLLNQYFRKRLSDQLRAMRESFSRITATLVESVLGIRVTQGFVRQDENAQMFAELVADHSAYNSAVLRTHGLFIPLLEFNSQLFIAVLLLVGGWKALQVGSAEGVGDVISFLFMANLFFAPISVLGNQYNQALTAMAGAERLFAMLDTAPDWSDPTDAVPASTLAGRVEFDKVTFGYDPSRPVLQDISFVAEPGQTIALVGHTGSGKSSIINLLTKFYLPQSGRVLLDGQDLLQLTGDSVHRQMGLVLQQNFLFRGTVAENIRFGRPSATNGEIIEVCRQLDCLDLIEALPQGFLTTVGERGAQLSLGQRQMVCFARALIADPRILILDEATSSIDSRTEHRLQKALKVLLAGRTSFVVAHRLSTIRQADLVLVLDHGHLVERGTHGELVRQGGIYAHLYERFAQSAA
ncbi:MAG: ABC transporter ATP-binding protein [Planctomycetaceae bacterium]|nr:ABC transporter ATP-binding protein [Planctomycetaceae bacterium]